jgi:hypothetical protein
MPDMVFGTSAYSRARGNLPELPVINMFVESAPTEQSGVVLQSRPGLVENRTTGSGPIRGLYQSEGVLTGEVFAVSGAEVFRGTLAIGTITGAGSVSFAPGETQLLINAGGPIYRTTGATVAAVTFPDSADVLKVMVAGGYFIAIREESGQYYFSAVNDGSSWAALDFNSAENQPDPLRDGLVVDGILLLFGSRSVEFHQPTGDADAPFAPIPGKVFSKGIIATGCAVNFDNTAAWIGAADATPPGVRPSLRVYIAGNTAEGISDAGIEEWLSQATEWALWTHTFEGHEFLVVRTNLGSRLFDAQTRQWCENQSWGRDNWRARCAVGGLFGDDEDGTIWEYGSGHVDAGGVLERRFRAGLPVSGSFSANNVRLIANVGETPELSGTYADPVAEMRVSYDGGRTWEEWEDAELGIQGDYRVRTEWRALGMFDDPGMLAEFRCTDPVPFRVSGVKINEPGGGRSR